MLPPVLISRPSSTWRRPACASTWPTRRAIRPSTFMSSCGTVGQDLPPKFANTFIPEPALGRGVVWVVEKGSAKGSGELWFPLGQVGSESYSVQVSVARAGFPEASTIARDCFSHM